MIDNFEQIKKLLKFENEDDFYFSQIIQRKKENPEVGSNSHVVKTYYIKSVSDLDYYKGEMMCLAEFHNARVCINLNRRSFEKVAFQNLKKNLDVIMNKDYKSVRKSYNSVCGLMSNEKDKSWIVDVDSKGREANDVLKCIDGCRPEGNKLKTIIETKNGVHLITSPFDIQQFRKSFPFIDIHKDNPSILYIPK